MNTLKLFFQKLISAQKEYLAKYRTGHTTLGCRITHMIGVPMIMAGIFGFAVVFLPMLFGSLGALLLSLPDMKLLADVAQVLTFLWVWHLTDPVTVTRLAAGTTLIIVGWLFQFAGHVLFEKNSPLFLANPFNPLSYTTAVIFVAEEFGRLILTPFRKR